MDDVSAFAPRADQGSFDIPLVATQGEAPWTLQGLGQDILDSPPDGSVIEL